MFFLALAISCIGSSLDIRTTPPVARPLRAVSEVHFLAAEGRGVELDFVPTAALPLGGVLPCSTRLTFSYLDFFIGNGDSSSYLKGLLQVDLYPRKDVSKS